MRGLPGVLLAAALLAPACEAAGPKVVYGEDDRMDLFAAPPEWQRLADSVVAVFKGDKVAPDGTLTLESFARRHNVCPSERFAEQFSGSYCSGSLVAPDLVLTAGHCLHLPSDPTYDTDVPECSNMKFVFGYAMKSAGDVPRKVPPGEVYRCASVVKRDYPGTGSRSADFALIRLDRAVRGHAPLALERGADAALGEPVAVIGTPSGLPVKIARGAAVRDASDPWFFVANLDSFGGNSGSAVFSQRTRRVVGIVVRGATDFREGPAGGCNVYNRLPVDGGRGEDVIKAGRILPFLDAAAARKADLGAAKALEPRLGEAARALDGRR